MKEWKNERMQEREREGKIESKIERKTIHEYTRAAASTPWGRSIFLRQSFLRKLLLT